jgi:uncharacterized surface protein with fasciclin (FAS1) repeats
MRSVALATLAVLTFGVAACSTSPSMSPVTPSAAVPDLAVTSQPDAGLSANPAGRSSLPTIAGAAAANPAFTTLVSALAKAGLVETFDGNRHYTVFAPTNDAFDAAAQALGFADGPALVGALDVGSLTAILTYHVTLGDRNSTSVISAGSVRMLDGNLAAVSVTNGVATIENAAIVAADLRASNGLIHVIDAVLLPPSLR